MVGKYYILDRNIVRVRKVEDNIVYCHTHIGVLVEVDISLFNSMKPLETNQNVFYIGETAEKEIRQLMDNFMEKYSPITYKFGLKFLKIISDQGTVSTFIKFDTDVFRHREDYRQYIFNRINEHIDETYKR